MWPEIGYLLSVAASNLSLQECERPSTDSSKSIVAGANRVSTHFNFRWSLVFRDDLGIDGKVNNIFIALQAISGFTLVLLRRDCA